jgi:hypothetical protein
MMVSLHVNDVWLDDFAEYSFEGVNGSQGLAEVSGTALQEDRPALR